MVLPSKHSSSARGWNLDDLGAGAFSRLNVCVHRAGLTSQECDLCSRTGPGSWKGPLLRFMLRCGHLVMLNFFFFKQEALHFSFARGPTNLVAEISPGPQTSGSAPD